MIVQRLIGLLAHLSLISISLSKPTTQDKLFNLEQNYSNLTIPQGELQGLVRYSRDGREFLSFQGIPYGKSQRFHESEPADNWNGVLDATKFGSPCLQFDRFRGVILGSETCLFLNVYTPKLLDNSPALPLPVMVFIHGGSFNLGSGGDYGPEYFMDEDVILVTINYRLGAFGFLETDFGSNVGMKDQVLSLKWVRDNIQYFGGNASQVTIFGESAGAASVALHILSPMSKGLFHGAISQSGSPYALVPQDPFRELKKVGTLVDCPVSNSKYLAECLAKTDGTYIVERIFALGSGSLRGFSANDIPIFAVTVDNSTSGAGSVFLPDTPSNILRSGNFARVPWITGANSHEGLELLITLGLSEATRKLANDHWTQFAPELFGYESYNCKASTDIRELYLGDNVIESFETMENVTNAGSDAIMFYPVKTGAVLFSKFSPVHLYYFSLRGPATADLRWPLLNITLEDGIPPAHIDELQYLFDIQFLYPPINPGSAFENFSDWFVKLWVSFAKDGTTPANWIPIGGPGIKKAGPPNTRNDNSADWYRIDKNPKMVSEADIFGGRLNLWENILTMK